MIPLIQFFMLIVSMIYAKYDKLTYDILLYRHTLITFKTSIFLPAIISPHCSIIIIIKGLFNSI